MASPGRSLGDLYEDQAQRHGLHSLMKTGLERDIGARRDREMRAAKTASPTGPAVSAASNALLEEMQRAGVLRGPNKSGYGFTYSRPDIDRMAESIVAGAPSPEAEDARAIMRLGRGMDLDDSALDPVIMSSDGQGFPSPNAMRIEGELGGVPVQQIWENQRKGWDGYGWTDQKIKALGRNPEPRELSPGGQAAWNWRNNELLLKGLLDANLPRSASGPLPSVADSTAQMNDRGMLELQPAPTHQQVTINPNSGVPDDFNQTIGAEDAERRFRDAAVADYWKNRNRTHGESGYLGATQNQEYLAGQGMSLLDAVPQAAWAANFSSDPLSALAEAADQRDIRKYGFAVEPVLPAGYGPAEGTKILREALLADAPGYDLWYRAEGPGKKDESWPTYAGSAGATFANGFLDPSFFATGPARGIVQRIGLGLLRAGRTPGMYGKMAGNIVRGYGSRLAKDAADATFWPIVKPGISEAVEEIPTNAALGAGFYATSGGGSGPKQPGPGDWFSSEGRTDRYVQDQESGEWRPPTQAEVEQQYANEMQKYQAGRKSRPAVVRQIQESLLQPK